ncbi:MAG: hypothetical protein AAFV38_06945 [Pseudomonadota bacterium]
MRQFGASFGAALMAALIPNGGMAQDEEIGPPIQCDRPYTVSISDTLSLIYLRAYGEQGSFISLYEHNIDRIGEDPNIVQLDLVLDIPCNLDGVTALLADSASTAIAENLPENETIIPVSFPDRDTVILSFSKTSAPAFIINSGIIDPYLEQITQVTEGRVRFVDPPETNSDPREQLSMVLAGKADAAYMFNGYLEDSHPLLQLPMLPLMGGSAEQTALSLWRLHEQYLSQTDYMAGVQLMGFIAAPAAHIWRLTEEPVSPGETFISENEYTVPYFDGLDTRGPAAVREENAQWLANYDAERGRPLTLALAHGAARAAGIWTDNRAVTEIDNGVYTPTFSVIFSNEAWSRISEADQEAILSVSGGALSARSASWDAFDNGHRAVMMAEGLNVVKADTALLAEIQDQSKIGIERWMKAATDAGVPAFEAVSFYIDSLKALQHKIEF